MKRIAVLALQGAFIEHERMLERLGVETFEVRQLHDWNQPKDGLVIPGGESTTMAKLLRELGLFEPVRQAIVGGLPVFGTCAGLILLARDTVTACGHRQNESLSGTNQGGLLATMDMAVVRNAYGRQLGSFFTASRMDGVGDDIPMTFIRAPYINKVWGGAVSLAEVDGHIVAAQQDNQLVTAFHPELNDDTRVHEYFLRMVSRQ